MVLAAPAPPAPVQPVIAEHLVPKLVLQGDGSNQADQTGYFARFNLADLNGRMLRSIQNRQVSLNAGIYLMQEVFTPQELLYGTVHTQTADNAGIITLTPDAVGAKGMGLCFAFDPTTVQGNAQAAAAQNNVPPQVSDLDLPGLVGGPNLAPLSDSQLEYYRTQHQCLVVDASMSDAHGNIEAVGYMDLLSNPTDEAASHLQGSDAANRIAWANVNGVTSPNVLQELNIKNTGPQYVAAVEHPAVAFDNDAFVEKEFLCPFVPAAFYDPAVPLVESKFKNMPDDPHLLPFSAIHFSCKYASYLAVKVIKQGVTVYNSHPGSVWGNFNNMMTMIYDFTGVTEETVKCRISINIQAGSYAVEDLQDVMLYLQGMSLYQMYYGSDSNDIDFRQMSLTHMDPSMELSTYLVSAIAGWLASSGLLQGVIWRRLKGALKKVLSFAKAKVWPIVRPLLAVASSALPGPASLVAQRLLVADPVVDVGVSALAASNQPVVQSDAQADFYTLSVQTHVCQLDDQKLPILIDTVSSDETLWQDMGESVKVPINSLQTPSSSCRAVVCLSALSKFGNRLNTYQASGDGVYVQQRLKVVFSKTNVPVEFKSVLSLGSSVEIK